MYLKQFFGDVSSPHPCAQCRGDETLDFRVRMAFQPILDVAARSIWAYEALVRGEQGEPAAEVIARVPPDKLYRFDQTCRVLAIDTAARLGMATRLSINFAPNAVYEPATCIRLTLAAAERCGFDPRQLIFEVTESEKIRDVPHVVRIIKDYQGRGFLTAIDDFGAGYAGLNLLAEGVETLSEFAALRDMSITRFQGFLFSRPALEALPTIDPGLWDTLDAVL